MPCGHIVLIGDLKNPYRVSFLVTQVLISPNTDSSEYISLTATSLPSPTSIKSPGGGQGE